MVSNLKIGIIDYSFCNINSVLSACHDVTRNVEVITKPQEIKNFDKLILPGVGNFESAILKLTNLGFYETLIEHAKKEKDLLGICLGMQLLFESSEEDGFVRKGLGLLSGNVLDLSNFVEKQVSVPHMGWSEVYIYNKDTRIVKNISDKSSFYFANSYFCEVIEKNLVGTFEHGEKNFSAIVTNNNNVFGVQFHPEKSQSNGVQILRNFIDVKK